MRMRHFGRLTALWAALLSFLLLAGCNSTSGDSPETHGNSPASSDLRIVSGSENRPLEPLIKKFASDNHIHIKMAYQGSVDIMLMLQSGRVGYGPVWPANSLWIDLGDRQKLVKDPKSILWSPVVLGVKKSVAQKLGWVGKKD